MAKEEKSLKTEFEKIARDHQEKLDQVLKRMTEENEKFKKSLGIIIRDHQIKTLQVQKEMKVENETLQKRLQKLYHTVDEVLEDASQNTKATTESGDKKMVDDLINNPPNCSACEFPMSVLRETQEGSATVVHFSCPICNIERMATVPPTGGAINWSQPDSVPGRG